MDRAKVRIFNYKCPTPHYSSIGGCVYEWTDKERDEPCLGCGKTYEETRTVWDMIRLRYYFVIPHDWRPKYMWYRLKCWVWKRYTTVKPRNLGHTWCDRSHLLPHIMFEILCQFVEKELRPGNVDWDATEKHASVRDEMEELYRWWTEEYQDGYPFCLPTEEYKKIEDVCKAEQEHDRELLDRCRRIIDISPYMWT